HIGFGNAPAVDERAWFGSVDRITLWRAGIDPRHQGLFLARRQREVVREFSVVVIGMPGRHLAAENRASNSLRPRPRFFIAQQRHGCGFARAMTTLAAVLQNRLYVLVESGRRRRNSGACEDKRQRRESKD